jgi:hypothetical protein
VEFSGDKTVFAHYVRIKIFTERGKELRSTIELPYLSTNRIEDIAGRTIKADGAIVELQREAIFEKTLINFRGVKIKAKTFAMPAVEPGVIVEYRWREVRQDPWGEFARLTFQREIPIQSIKYTLKSSLYSFAGFRTKAFNMENTSMTPEKDKRFSYSMTNVHAFQSEPHMPPEDQVRPWMLAYFQGPYSMGSNKSIYDGYQSKMKVNDDVRRAAQAAIGDATDPNLKLERLFDFCKSKIKNIDDDASGLSGDDLAKVTENKTAAQTLNRRMGTSWDINLLFGALANSAGFEARVAQLADRSDIFYNPNEFEFLMNLYFMSSYNIAVRMGNEWRFFDPASQYVPFGMLRWQEEGGAALVTDPVLPILAKAPLSPAEKSVQKRTAKLRLSEDGTLEGDVRIEYTGHFAVEKKEAQDDQSVEQREESLREMIKERMSPAELFGIRIENVVDPVKPFVYSFHIRVPGYAQRTGKRLFFQPAFFQKGVGAVFSAGARKHSIYFRYLWMEDDTVFIELPAGFALENAEAPRPFSSRDVADYKVTLSVLRQGEALEYRRTFKFNALLFPPSSYSGLKLMFDALHGRDNRTITLKQNAASQ